MLSDAFIEMIKLIQEMNAIWTSIDDKNFNLKQVCLMMIDLEMELPTDPSLNISKIVDSMLNESDSSSLLSSGSDVSSYHHSVGWKTAWTVLIYIDLSVCIIIDV